MKHTILKVILSLFVLTGCTTEGTDWYVQPDAGDTDGDSDIDTDSDCDSDSDSDTDSETESETDSETETESNTGTGEDTDSETDSETGSDSDSETETESDTGPDTDTAGSCLGPGVYLDAVNSLCWELSPPTIAITYTAADARCSALSLDGASDWRVPDINELQVLVDGCATAGCGVHDSSCLYEYCDDTCPVCSLYGGPGPGGCYWDTSLTGNCSSAGYWSSSLQVGVAYTSRWCIHFGAGSYMFEGGAVAHVRCVRTP